MNNEERFIFEEYTMNRFSKVEESENADTTFLNVWNKILEYSEIFGVDKAINDNVRLAVSELAKTASHNLEKWSESAEFKAMSQQDRIKMMCNLGLEGIYQK